VEISQIVYPRSLKITLSAANTAEATGVLCYQTVSGGVKYTQMDLVLVGEWKIHPSFPV